VGLRRSLYLLSAILLDLRVDEVMLEQVPDPLFYSWYTLYCSADIESGNRRAPQIV
jgi:hypothetical protein